MSARSDFLQNISGIHEAANLDLVAAGNAGGNMSLGIGVLRRGILITALSALETFIRERTAEVLVDIARWPARYEDLPLNFREAATLNALSPLERYAKMLKRRGEDYESIIHDEIKKMSKIISPDLAFSRFISGDFTGNMSDTSISDLLSIFQISNCWDDFRPFVADIGLGVPSVRELMKDIARKRHRSAHSSNYSPTSSDIDNIPSNLLCIGICFDTAISASVNFSLHRWREWSPKQWSWRQAIDLYFIDPVGNRFRLRRFPNQRALKMFDDSSQALAHIHQAHPGKINVIVNRDMAGRPTGWHIR